MGSSYFDIHLVEILEKDISSNDQISCSTTLAEPEIDSTAISCLYTLADNSFLYPLTPTPPQMDELLRRKIEYTDSTQSSWKIKYASIVIVRI